MKTITLLSILLVSAAIADTRPPEKSPPYTREQALQGKVVYIQHCIGCHGDKLDNGMFASPLIGEAFYRKWGGRSTSELLARMQSTMPAGAPGSLAAEQYQQVLAYMFQQTGFVSGESALSRQLSWVRLPVPSSGLATEEILQIPPDPKPRHNPLDTLTTVTDELLRNPPAEDWLSWRRTYDAQGFSPLKNIKVSNVKQLRLAWSWSMPAGRTITTPLVHDGVIFAVAAGDVVHALDAKTGDILWRYDTRAQGHSARYALRAISLYGNNLFLPTDDGNIIALDSKTGTVKWDRSIVDPAPFRFSGGPLIADGKIVLGTSTGHAPGHNFIVALDAETGDEQWRFYTVARKGDVGGQSWNGLDDSVRSGAGVWMPGSYDPTSKLVFFGTGNSYNPEPLRELTANADSNDGLYTNSTLALDIATGELVWHFQHLPNDQWNYDEAFERMIVPFSDKGRAHKVVLSGGKLGIFDALKTEDGGYLSTLDLGLQDVVERVDPLTGERQVTASALPSLQKTRFVCPSHRGTRTWRPTAFDERSKMLYVPFGESCMKLRPPPLFADDIMLGGVGTKAYPRPDSDGLFGGIAAIDATSGTTLWTKRQRAVPSTGLLATAGGLIFAGSLDRRFSAFHASTGQELWSTRLSGIPGASPISFSVDGKQYIAITSGEHAGWVRNMDTFLSPEIDNPKEISPAIWVFELSEEN